MSPDFTRQLQQRGFALAPGLASAHEIAALTTLFETADVARAAREGQTFGARNLLGLAPIQDFAVSPALSACLTSVLGPGFSVVRGLFFDKTEAANWPVLWHQDLSQAVAEKCDVSGWTNWSLKRGVQHVQPPAAVLAQMVTMRLHLDDCGADNGPLRVIPGSHADGVLTREAIQNRTQYGDHAVLAEAGDALFMRPLILHASSPAQRPRHRRVLHLEFAPDGLLPAGLAWARA